MKFYRLIGLMQKYKDLHLLDYIINLLDNEEFLSYNAPHIAHENR
jgi:hypothetical protein